MSSSSESAVLQGAVKIAAPAGYCLDQSSQREKNDSLTSLMGPCSARTATKPALIALSIGQAGSGLAMVAGGAEMAAYFTSEEGRATLSPRGKAVQVQVVEALSVKDVFLMHVQEREGPSYWRAILGLKGRLVSISVKGAPHEPLAPDDGRAILNRAVAAMRRANLH